MKKSFTLIEILVVATIISFLISGGIVSYSYLSRQSRDARRKTDIEQIRSALEMYRSQNNSYPIYTGDCSSSSLLPTLTPYLGKIPDDPKSNYNYYCNITNTSYTISAYLETSSGSCGSGCGTTCTYSVGPYGQTCPQ